MPNDSGGQPVASQVDFMGTVAPGRGLGVGLMINSEILDRFRELLGFSAVPGTLNVRLPEPFESSSTWRYMRSAEISPDWEAKSGQAEGTLGTPPIRSSCSAMSTCGRRSA